MIDKTTKIQGAPLPCIGGLCISKLNLHDLVHTFCIIFFALYIYSFPIKMVKNAFSSRLAYKNASFILLILVLYNCHVIAGVLISYYRYFRQTLLYEYVDESPVHQNWYPVMSFKCHLPQLSQVAPYSSPE